MSEDVIAATKVITTQGKYLPVQVCGTAPSQNNNHWFGLLKSAFFDEKIFLLATFTYLLELQKV